MTKETAIKLFEQRQVRSIWNDEEEKWYFSIVDIVGILSESVDQQAYWRKLKQRLKVEGNETVTNCHALKMIAADGKMRLTDVADTQQLFRLIFSKYWYPKLQSQSRNMETRSLKLPDNFINILVDLPERGMGYQIVKVILRSGITLHRHKVLNSEFLMLEKNEIANVKDIEKIELETN